MTSLTFPSHCEPLVRQAIAEVVHRFGLWSDGPMTEILFLPISQPTDVDFDRLRVTQFHGNRTEPLRTCYRIGPVVRPYIDGFEGLGDEQPQGVSGVAEVDDES